MAPDVRYGRKVLAECVPAFIVAGLLVWGPPPRRLTFRRARLIAEATELWVSVLAAVHADRR